MNKNALKMNHLEMEKHLWKLSAWLQTFSFVLEELEEAGAATDKGSNIAAALNMAIRWSTFSEILFLILDGLQNCAQEITALHNCDHELLKVEN